MIKSITAMGALGCLLFTGFLIFMSYSGIASAMRDENGQFRKGTSFKSVLGGILFMSFLLSLLFFGNVNYAQSQQASPDLLHLWLHALGVFFVIHIYDLLVLDYLIVVKWHPKFLNLPNTPYYSTFRPHVIGFFKGIPLGIIASLFASLLFLWTR